MKIINTLTKMFRFFWRRAFNKRISELNIKVKADKKGKRSKIGYVLSLLPCIARSLSFELNNGGVSPVHFEYNSLMAPLWRQRGNTLYYPLPPQFSYFTIILRDYVHCCDTLKCFKWHKGQQKCCAHGKLLK